MEDKRSSFFRIVYSSLFVTLFLTAIGAVINNENEPNSGVFIISMDKSVMPMSFASHSDWYTMALASVIGTDSYEKVKSSIIHIYDTVFEGFAAKLTSDQAKTIREFSGFIEMFPDTIRQLHTTHSPEFLDLNASVGIWPQANFGSEIIVGMFDTGVWPESNSFNDEGMNPVPGRWAGICVDGPGFNASMCNRKLVGARFFSKGYEAMSGPINETAEYRSPRDSDGHGTHTASTAAGISVPHASLLGYGDGIARGMAPMARVAVYKVCWQSGCFDSDILAAFDQAIADGVDVISLSVGGGVIPYNLDSIAIGAFGAMERGALVACSAGNSGPSDMTVTNVAPWITTVGAGTMDRAFPADVVLNHNGDITVYSGVSLYSGNPPGDRIPLIYSGDAAAAQNTSDSASAKLCLPGSLDPNLVKGKIVLCDRGDNPRVEKGWVVMAAGGAGMILANAASDGEGLIADSHLLPATGVGFQAGNAIRTLIRSSGHLLTGTIRFQGTKLGIAPAPVIASFSSRGPNPETPEILKPDIIAPGVNILAAWTGAIGPTGLAKDPRRVEFNVISGTSMACPHISGLAALLKAARPQWSPAAIKSALMTSAYLVDNTARVMSDESTGNRSTPFDFGAGHVDPEQALDPGLIYDLTADDYVGFLCGLNYTHKEIKLITRRSVSCSGKAFLPGNLNYPSFSAVFDQTSSPSSTVTLSRTVTNVGPPSSLYTAEVVSPPGVKLHVTPEKLAFTESNQKLSYSLTIAADELSVNPGASETVFGTLAWRDGSHHVSSPIAITKQQSF